VRFPEKMKHHLHQSEDSLCFTIFKDILFLVASLGSEAISQVNYCEESQQPLHLSLRIQEFFSISATN
jgi:hypothetical protein